ncbi:MAG: 2-hydroxyacid dehydrogenase [Eubacterium sp.]|nr:2-hydroxyacid dehydrogenase [Eubacterium sp.]
MKILLTNHYEGKPAEIIKSAVPDGFELEMLESVSQQELEGKVKEADYLLVSGRLKINRTVLGNAQNIKMIQRTGVGLDSIDLEYIRNHDVPFYVNKGVNAQSVAEHTILLMLASLRNLVEINENTKRGIWKKQAQGVCTHELCGKTVGLIGMGAIGRKVAGMLKAFGAEVLYNDVSKMKQEDENALGIKFSTREEIIEKSDIISLHCPLTDDTRHMINDRAVNKMKNGVILINTARGGLIDEAALINGIKNGKIAGAGIDVYEKEPVDNSEVLNLQNVITTPHIGGVTYDSFYQMMYQAMRNIEMFDKGQLQEIEQSRYKF